MKKFLMLAMIVGAIFSLAAGDTPTLAQISNWRKQAESGDAVAQNKLGLCYANGDGVPKDLSEAVRWYRKAAEQGHAPAQSALRRLEE